MRQSSNRLNLFFLYRLPVIILCLFIFWQSSYPSIISMPLFPYDDKVLHFVVYALLSFLAARNLAAEKPFWTPAKIQFLSIFLICLFGLSDEIHQAFVSSRCASAGDFIADCAGSITGCLFYFNFLYRKQLGTFLSRIPHDQ
ncbi:VanZ family protein [Desulfobacula sp.]